VPFAVIDWIIVDPVRGAEGYSTIGAPNEHDVNSRAEPSRLQASEHVNVVVGTHARTIHRYEKLPIQSDWIDQVTADNASAHTNLGDLVKRRRNCRVLRIGGTEAQKRAGKVGRAADEEIAV